VGKVWPLAQSNSSAIEASGHCYQLRKNLQEMPLFPDVQKLQSATCNGTFPLALMKAHPFSRPASGPTCPICEKESDFQKVEMPDAGMSRVFLIGLASVALIFLAFMLFFS
jgi:hypothetical protein